MYQTFIKPLVVDIKTFVLDTLFPITCLACNREGFFICPECKATMKILEHQRCIVCQLPAPFGITHPKCLTSLHAPTLAVGAPTSAKLNVGADQLISCYDYHDDKIAQIIIKGKYNFIADAYKELGKMVAQKIRDHHPYLLQANSYFLIPIPLHPTRRRWRGFNQAEVLCQALSQELSLPVADVLIRNKITKTQKDLNKAQRLKNVSGAFSVNPTGYQLIPNSYFLLIDDVTTTGATLQQAAKALKQHGAAKVICLTVARD